MGNKSVHLYDRPAGRGQIQPLGHSPSRRADPFCSAHAHDMGRPSAPEGRMMAGMAGPPKGAGAETCRKMSPRSGSRRIEAAGWRRVAQGGAAATGPARLFLSSYHWSLRSAAVFATPMAHYGREIAYRLCRERRARRVGVGGGGDGKAGGQMPHDDVLSQHDARCCRAVCCTRRARAASRRIGRAGPATPEAGAA